MKKMILFFAIMSSVLMTFIQPATGAISSQEAVITATVSSINKYELYANGNRFFIAPDVKITLNTEIGREISLKSLVSVGQIEMAELHIVGNRVVKIVIIEMRQ